MVRYGTEFPKSRYRLIQDQPVPNAPYATVPCSLQPSTFNLQL
ncbi:hypothetical protein [Moorena sp. SIO4G3]|nr:hypothetical protein [Moorena sp. SIO4G3]